MKIKQVQLKAFKRFHELTINLGDKPKKVIALVGPNGCGKSSVFDAFEVYSSQYRPSNQDLSDSYFSKAMFSPDLEYHPQNAVQLILESAEHKLSKKSFQIRSAYRFTGSLNVTSIRQMPDVLDDVERPKRSIEIDGRFKENFERLISTRFNEFCNGNKSGTQMREELLGKINDTFSRGLDIRVSGIGNIQEVNNGKLFFEKGKSKKFPYENLSAGEKEVIDILLDLIVKEKVFDDTAYCIDEPELYVSTSIQRRLLVEIYKMIPDNCQLWIATHSIGFLRALREELKDDCQVVNFSDQDFDTSVELIPMLPTRKNWQAVFAMALEDLAGLVAPKVLIYCEGKIQPGGNNEEMGLDAIVYNNIFEYEYHDVLFVSSSGETQPNQSLALAIMVLSKALRDVEIFLLKDRDENSDEKRGKWLKETSYNRILIRREIENYLFDYEVIIKAYPNVSRDDYSTLIKDCHAEDVKNKAGALKLLCGELNSMNKEEFKIHLSKFLTQEMTVYSELKNCIFNATIL